jgi:hypothetical protein
MLMRASKAIQAAGLLVALVLASPLQADCRDPAQPRVDWTSCARGHLMLEQEDFTEGVFSRAVGWKANFTRANQQRARPCCTDQ